MQDLLSFVAPVRRLGSDMGEVSFSPRWDLVAGAGVLGSAINIQDVTALIAGVTAHPPMFGGGQAFGRICPFPS
jgi:hypothetical protein